MLSTFRPGDSATRNSGSRCFAFTSAGVCILCQFVADNVGEVGAVHSLELLGTRKQHIVFEVDLIYLCSSNPSQKSRSHFDGSATFRPSLIFEYHILTHMRRAVSPSIKQLFRCTGAYEHIPTLFSEVWDRDGPCQRSRESKKASSCFSSRLSPSDLSAFHRTFATKNWREGFPGWWMHKLNMTDHGCPRI